MSKEKWVDVCGYEGLYEISNKGVVRTKYREIKNDSGLTIHIIPSKVVESHRPKGFSITYVVLHNGSKYVKEDVKELSKKSF